MLQPSVTGQPGHRDFELSGLFVQVRALTGQPDSPDTSCESTKPDGLRRSTPSLLLSWGNMVRAAGRRRSAGGVPARRIAGRHGHFQICALPEARLRQLRHNCSASSQARCPNCTIAQAVRLRLRCGTNLTLSQYGLPRHQYATRGGTEVST